MAGGPYLITQGTLSANGNYSINFSGSSLAITPVPLSITADAQSKVYGAADPVFTASYTGFVNGETPAVLTGSLSLVRAPGQNVGSYAIAPSGLASSNYAITFNPGTLTITKASLSATADSKNKIYGSADPAFTVSYSGFVNGDTQAALGGTLGLTRAPGENVGSYLITASGLTSLNYTITFNTGTLTITKAALSIAADSKSKSYGAADPAFSANYSGFVNGDSQTSLIGTLGFTRAPGENVGGYLITPNGLTSSNYTITFNTGTLTIAPAPLSVTADNKSKVYGATDPALTFRATGFQFADTQASVLTGALTRVAGESVAGSPYVINQGSLAANANYTISFTGNTLAITPASLTVSAQSKAKTYGATDPALTLTATGFQFADTQASVLTGALARVAGESVAGSPYAINQGSVAANANYSISFTGSTLAITPASLTVVAQSKAKVYGAADPMLTFTVSGFQFADTQASVLTGALARVAGESVAGSPYAINQGSLVANANYTISFTGSTLAITPASLTVVAQSKAKTYGATDPALTFTATGFQFADTQASVLTGALTRVAGESVAGSPYAINQGSLAANANYTISFTGSTLAITPASLTVTAQSKAKTYGAADPALTFTVSGFQFADTQASVLTGALTRVAGESVAGSPYAINQGSVAANANYTISFTGSTLAITPASLTVAADNKNKTYGAADPVFTASYSGFVNAESATVLNGALTFTRAPGQNVGSYAITPGGVTASNYAITFSAGTLTITKASLVVTADNKIKTFGAADPAFTATETGFVNGETSAVLGGTLVFSRAPGEGVGTYPISPSGLTSGNYVITFNDGTLTIVAPAPTIRSLAQTTPGVIQVTWSSVSNASYRVQFVSTVNSTNWIDLPGDVLATGNTSSKSDPITPTNRFYRIRVLP